MAENEKTEPSTFEGPFGNAVVLPPDRRGQGRKVPRGHEQYHGFWRVVYSPSPQEKLLSAPEVLQAKDEETATDLAEKAVKEGFGTVRHARYSRM